MPFILEHEMKTRQTLNSIFMPPWKEGGAEPNLQIASPLTKPQDMQLLHAVLSAWEGLGGITGESLPCPCFTPLHTLQEMPVSHELITSFVSVIVSEHC